ncbi:hypothetical protein EYF80_027070 [Liparis tanakae]|uniref:Uncharacterized protein n=1 Tax=Liparis tanakae TaxID=230148 RepID=A0A4Z2HA16_9TELE|nr:hypothetical protein EYF80_027070 [Liparis tanakae]
MLDKTGHRRGKTYRDGAPLQARPRARSCDFPLLRIHVQTGSRCDSVRPLHPNGRFHPTPLPDRHLAHDVNTDTMIHVDCAYGAALASERFAELRWT